LNVSIGRRPTHKKDTRADAAWVLYQVLEHGRSCRELMPLIFERHSTQQNAWMQEMIYGSLRQIPKLQKWLRSLLQKPLKGDQKCIEHLIMLGFYQLAFSRTSEHAAVSETVGAAAILGQHRLKGMVNGVLRNFQREELAQQTFEDPHISSGLPKWLFKLVQDTYPNNIDSIITEMNARPPLWLRVNQLNTTLEDFVISLDNAGVAHEVDEKTQAILINQRTDITSLPGFQEGAFSVQDKAAQFSALLLEVQSNEHVLDCCCAPGGKTAHILESQPNLAKLVAIDSEQKRLVRVEENMLRLGHSNNFGNRLCIDCADATLFDCKTANYPLFDKILLDAPCSATGVIRRHPDIRWLRKKTDIETLVTLQASILKNIWQALKPGGVLLYATCSILPQENSQQVAQFLKQTANATLLPIHPSETNEQPGWQILPGESQMDGFYYARLLKSSL